MTILLTGATGYLGSNIARRLAQQGRDLILLVRDPKGLPRLAGEGRIEWIKGDIRDDTTLRGALERADVVIHSAALVKMWHKDRRAFEEVNVQALENLLNLAKQYETRRILYTSSFMVLGPSNGHILTEQSVRQHRGYHNDYERTKCQAHQIALRATKEGFPIVIVYPGVIYGPGPTTDGNLLGGIILKFLRRQLPGLIGDLHKKWAFSFIEDVVEGHLQALEKGRAGEGYILGGENLSLKDFLDQLAALSEKPPPKLAIPYWIAWLAGRWKTLKADLTGISPDITHEAVNVYKHDWCYSSEKAIRELGYSITPFTEGLRTTVQYYQERLKL
jgi:NAD+-dependent farnesol dehydrogenase